MTYQVLTFVQILKEKLKQQGLGVPKTAILQLYCGHNNLYSLFQVNIKPHNYPVIPQPTFVDFI